MRKYSRKNMDRVKDDNRYCRSILVYFLISLTVMFFTLTVSATGASPAKPTVTIAYFYINPCESCKVAEEFTLKLDGLLRDVTSGVEVDLHTFNIFRLGYADRMLAFCQLYGVPEENREVPLLFMNGLWLQGASNIEQQAASLFVTASDNRLHPAGLPNLPEDVISMPSSEAGAISDIGANETRIIYFSAPACNACEKTEKILSRLDTKVQVVSGGVSLETKVTVQQFSLGDIQNINRIKWYFSAYGVPEEAQSAPILFFGNTWVSGEDVVFEKLLEDITTGKGLRTKEMPENTGKDLQKEPDLESPSYSLAAVLATGLLNGLNPCSLAMMLFFLSLLAVRPSGVLKPGLVFAVGKFLGFCLLGFVFQGLFSRMQMPWFQTISRISIIVLAAVMVLLNLNDFRAAGKESYQSIRLQLPKKLRGLNHRWLKKAAELEGSHMFLLSCLLLGLIVSVGDFLCTGQIYLATILYVMKSSPGMDSRAILTFLAYGIAFIFPLLVLTFLVHRGRAVFDVTEWVRSHMAAIKLANACFFILFGIWAVFFW